MKKIMFIAIIFSIILISGCISTNNYQRDYAGVELHFRGDLSKAQDIDVYPGEDALKNVLLNNDIEKIKIAFISNETENAYYLADTYELGYKLTIIYRYKFNETKKMESVSLNTTEEAYTLYNETEPVILLLGPSQANETSIRVNENLIILQGQSFDKTDRTYTDLDLSTDKLLLVLMGE